MPMFLPRLACAAVLVASIGSVACYDPNRLTAPDDVFSITASPATIPANGFSTSQITARVDPATRRDLKFSFSKSEGGTLSVPASQVRGPDANGEISVFLTSDTTPRTVLVTAEAKDGDTIVASRSVAVTFEAATPSSVIRLTVSSSQVEADAVSSVQLRAEVNPALTNRMVTFRTTSGSFEQGASPPVRELANRPTGADGVAIAQLYASGEVGTAVVTASAGGFSDSQTVTFTPAAPDFITLRATPLTVSRALETNSTTLTATLSRSVGTMTPNARVEFSAVNDESGTSFGRFEEVTRSTDGQVTAKFVPGTAAPLGLATITARVPGTNVSAQVKITITP
jgi:hypothetical protein